MKWKQQFRLRLCASGRFVAGALNVILKWSDWILDNFDAEELKKLAAVVAEIRSSDAPRRKKVSLDDIAMAFKATRKLTQMPSDRLN